MTNADSPLGELNHRVKNNFQIIISLMNLKKRLLPPERREDIRFLQDHVQSMAVAYRLAYASGDMAGVSISELLSEVISELRQIAVINLGRLQLVCGEIHDTLGLDRAIAFALYLAVVLPPYMDHACKSESNVIVSASVDNRLLTISISGRGDLPVEFDSLRRRLIDAYLEQLNAEVLPSTDPTNIRFRFPLDGMQPVSSERAHRVYSPVRRASSAIAK